MKIRSAKNKGQRASREVRDLLLSKFPTLQKDDVHVTPASVNGVDILLSPKAQELVPLEFEVKNQERASIWSWIEQATKNAKNHTPVVVFKKNGQQLHICMEFTKFLEMIGG